MKLGQACDEVGDGLFGYGQAPAGDAGAYVPVQAATLHGAVDRLPHERPGVAAPECTHCLRRGVPGARSATNKVDEVLKTAAYDRFGREDPDFSLERTDKVAALKAAAGA
ncbi:MAG: hypothetical protein KJZ83_19875 [Burkholderiaceae bacterium]|nr:hypothetical protein [Burkholderiaceae bacterium]